MVNSMNVVDVTQRTDAWLNWRKKGITATDSVVLYSPFSAKKTKWRLWAEKKGKAKEVDLSMNPLVQAGIRNEPIARKLFEQQNNCILFNFCCESSETPYMITSLDGYDEYGQPVEFKCPHETTWKDVKNNGVNSNAYSLHYPQIQHQLYVTKAKQGRLVFYFNGELETFIINRDKQLIDIILKNGEDFFKSLNDDIEPPLDPNRDFYIPKGDDIKEWLILANDYCHALKCKKELMEEVEKIKLVMNKTEQKLSHLMGDFLRADYGGIQITHFEKRGSVNYEKLINDNNPELLKHIELYRNLGSRQTRITPIEDLNSRVIVSEELEEQSKKFNNIKPNESFY